MSEYEEFEIFWLKANDEWPGKKLFELLRTLWWSYIFRPLQRFLLSLMLNSHTKLFCLIYVLEKKTLIFDPLSHQNQRIARCRSLESVHYIISDLVSIDELIISDFYVLTLYINSAAALFGQSLRWRPTWATSSSSTPSASPFPSPSSSSPTRSSSRQSDWGYVLCMW